MNHAPVVLLFALWGVLSPLRGQIHSAATCFKEHPTIDEAARDNYFSDIKDYLEHANDVKIEKQQNGHWKILDQSGIPIYPEPFKNLSYKHEKLLFAKGQNDLWGVLAKDLSTIIEPSYEDLNIETDFYGYKVIALSAKKNGKWGYINDNNEIILPFEYDYVIALNESYLWVSKQDKQFFYNRRTKKFSDITGYCLEYNTFYSKDVEPETIIIKNTEGKYGLFKTDGTFPIPAVYDRIEPSRHNLFRLTKKNIEKRELNGFVRYDGSIILDAKHKYAEPTYINKETQDIWFYTITDGKNCIYYENSPLELPYEKFRHVKENEPFIVYNKGIRGKSLYNFLTDKIITEGYKTTMPLYKSDAKCTYIGYTQDGLCGLKDVHGNVVIEPLYSNISIQSNNVVNEVSPYVGSTNYVMKGGLVGYLDASCDTIIVKEPAHHKILHNRYAYTRVMRNGKWGYLDSRGDLIIPHKFTHAGIFNNNKALVRIGQEEFYINEKGERLKDE